LSAHAPAKFRTYTRVHGNRMAQAVESGFVREHTLIFERLEGFYTLRGEIACRGNIVVTVNKIIEILESDSDDDLVQTSEYSYNASVRGEKSFLRNDNAPHERPYEGHGDPHHRHELNWRTEENLRGSPVWVGEQGWPTLGQFLDAVYAWYCDHREELPDPDAFPTLGQGSR
jgi:Family of unknown function (DUF6516)